MYVQAGTLFLGLLLGGMGFFSFVVAPSAFRTLTEADAGRFVRALFPHYYLFVIAASVLATIGCVGHGPVSAKIMAGVALVGVFLRQWLMPRINALRDRQLAGDAVAATWFNRAHGTSVALNFVQMVAAALAVALYV
jgi:hypothetical protein